MISVWEGREISGFWGAGGNDASWCPIWNLKLPPFLCTPSPGCDQQKETDAKAHSLRLAPSWNKDVVGRQEAVWAVDRRIHLPTASVLKTPAALHLSEQLALVSQPIRLWREWEGKKWHHILTPAVTGQMEGRFRQLMWAMESGLWSLLTRRSPAGMQLNS